MNDKVKTTEPKEKEITFVNDYLIQLIAPINIEVIPKEADLTEYVKKSKITEGSR